MAGQGWTAADLPDLSGRSAVVTGASGGLGEIIAAELAGAGATVTLAVRNLDKGPGGRRPDEQAHRRPLTGPGGPGLGLGVRRQLVGRPRHPDQQRRDHAGAPGDHRGRLRTAHRDTPLADLGRPWPAFATPGSCGVWRWSARPASRSRTSPWGYANCVRTHPNSCDALRAVRKSRSPYPAVRPPG